MPPLKPPFNFNYKLFFFASILVSRSMAMPLQFIGQSGTLIVVVGSHEAIMYVLANGLTPFKVHPALVLALLHSPLMHLAFKFIVHYTKTWQIGLHPWLCL
jgi:hypothetical protein